MINGLNTVITRLKYVFLNRNGRIGSSSTGFLKGGKTPPLPNRALPGATFSCKTF